MRVRPCLKSFLLSLLPPFVSKILRSCSGNNIVFEGNYSSWKHALAMSSGYDDYLILDKVLDATLLVSQGHAAYERDSVVFDQIHYSWPLLAGLLLAAVRSSGHLEVLDYGGSLGSSFFQNRRFLSHVSDLNWTVIEQSHFVHAALKNINHPQLSFSDNLAHYLADNSPNVVLLSGVLQCVEDPWGILELVLKAGCDIVILDRTSYVLDGQPERICLQRVPSSIYSATYPCRFFVERVLVDFIELRGYKLLESFHAVDSLDSNYVWKGHIFLRN